MEENMYIAVVAIIFIALFIIVLFFIGKGTGMLLEWFVWK